MQKIIKPTFLFNEKIIRANIQRMADKALKSNVRFRPHFKTHQSAEIGEWFREAGVDQITVSSVGMATYFAHAGWTDILIAFPVNIHEIDAINRLAAKIRLSLLIENKEAILFLSENLLEPIQVYLKIDTGYHRTGIAAENSQLISELLLRIQQSRRLNFTGFLAHAGHSYHAKSTNEILSIHRQSIKKMQILKNEFQTAYPDCNLSIGDTPSCSITPDFDGIDEIRPGNFVFYDLMQQSLGACSFSDIAVAVMCPVVAVHESRNEIVIYGGAVHLSKEFVLNENGQAVFGRIVIPQPDGWSSPVENTFVTSLSQEHGIISDPGTFIRKVKPGDILGIVPIHSCLTANLFPYYLTCSGQKTGRYRQE